MNDSLTGRGVIAAAFAMVLGLTLPASQPAFAQQAPTPSQPATPGPPKMGSGLAGQLVFERTCATCHVHKMDEQPAEGRAQPLPVLQQYPSDRVYQALVDGKMKGIGDTLSEQQRLDVSQWLGGQPVGATAKAGDISNMSGRCESHPPLADAWNRPQWNGWGVDLRNSRYQPRAAAGLSGEDVPKLKLRWAFGIPNGVETYSQPTVVAGRVFFGADNGYVYSLSAQTGCAYWSFQAEAPVRTAPVIAPLSADIYAVYFGDIRANLYAVNAQTGALIWKAALRSTPLERITGAPRVYNGVAYVGFSSGEQVTGASPTHECCKSSGSVAAVNAATGALLWRTHMLPAPQPLPPNDIGTRRFGPAGAAVWNTPTVDPKRGLLYVGTGSGYAGPAHPLMNAVVALDLDNGAVRWAHQEVPDDIWLAGCVADKPRGNCPNPLGPDYDYGSSPILVTRNGRDLLLAGSKSGTVVAIDPDRNGQLVWRKNLAETPPPAHGQIVFGGAADRSNAYYALQTGGLVALDQLTGTQRWFAKLDQPADRRGQAAAVTVLDGVVFTGGWDGKLSALRASDGKLIWEFATATTFETVNGVPAKGGSMGAPGPTVAEGMLFVGSGYVGVRAGMPGNVLLAFGLD